MGVNTEYQVIKVNVITKSKQTFSKLTDREAVNFVISDAIQYSSVTVIENSVLHSYHSGDFLDSFDPKIDRSFRTNIFQYSIREVKND
jgi:hypothetical protein